MTPRLLWVIPLLACLGACGPGSKAPGAPPPTRSQPDPWDTPDYTLPQWSQAFSDTKLHSLAEIPESARRDIGVPRWGLSLLRGSAFWTRTDEQGYSALYVYNGHSVVKLLDESEGLWKGLAGSISHSEQGGRAYLYSALGFHMGLNLGDGWTIDLDSGKVHRDRESYRIFAASDFGDHGWDTTMLFGEEAFAWEKDGLDEVYQEKGAPTVYLYDGQTYKKRFTLPSFSYPLNGSRNSRGNFVFAGVENFEDFNGFQYWTLLEVDPTGQILQNRTGVPQTEVPGLLSRYALETLRLFKAGPETAPPPAGNPVTAENLLLRQKPDPSSPSAGSLTPGTPVEILEIQPKAVELQGIRAPWMRIRSLTRKEGWVFGTGVEERQVFTTRDPLSWNDFQILDGHTGTRVFLGSSWKKLKTTYQALGRLGPVKSNPEELKALLGPLLSDRLFLPPGAEAVDFGSFLGVGVADRTFLLVLKGPPSVHRRGIQTGQTFVQAMSTVGKSPDLETVEWGLPGQGRIYGFALKQDPWTECFLLMLGEDNRVQGLVLFDGLLQK